MYVAEPHLILRQVLNHLRIRIVNVLLRLLESGELREHRKNVDDWQCSQVGMHRWNLIRSYFDALSKDAVDHILRVDAVKFLWHDEYWEELDIFAAVTLTTILDVIVKCWIAGDYIKSFQLRSFVRNTIITPIKYCRILLLEAIEYEQVQPIIVVYRNLNSLRLQKL